MYRPPGRWTGRPADSMTSRRPSAPWSADDSRRQVRGGGAATTCAAPPSQSSLISPAAGGRDMARPTQAATWGARPRSNFTTRVPQPTMEAR